MARAAALLFPLAETLMSRDRWPTRSSIATEMGVAPGTIQGWLNHLAHHRAIRSGDGVVIDRPRLLGVLAAHRVASQRPERPIRSALTTTEIHATLVDAGVPHVFCMFTAANQWAFFEPRSTHQIYIAQRHRGTLSSLLATPRGGIVEPFVETVQHIPSGTRGGIPVTDPLLTIADLRAHPEGGAHAAFLEANLLERIS